MTELFAILYIYEIGHLQEHLADRTIRPCSRMTLAGYKSQNSLAPSGFHSFTMRQSAPHDKIHTSS